MIVIFYFIRRIVTKEKEDARSINIVIEYQCNGRNIECPNVLTVNGVQREISAKIFNLNI